MDSSRSSINAEEYTLRRIYKMLKEEVIGRGRMLPPLPERMRPHDLEGYVGQRHLIGQGCILRNMLETGNLSSFILWGPPGVGKTTLSRIVASSLNREFFTLSAVSAGVKDVREVTSHCRDPVPDQKQAGDHQCYV